MNPPLGFREGHSGDLACPHRDVSCCSVCAKSRPEIVEVYGQHFWVPSAKERASLNAAMASPKLQRAWDALVRLDDEASRADTAAVNDVNAEDES